MAADPALRRVRFPCDELAEQLAAFAERWPAATADAAGRAFVAPDGVASLRPPAVAPRPSPGERVRLYADRLVPPHGVELVLLLRAGAMALGCWVDGELVAHKALRKYVVRGHGHAQPTHLKTRGKSRYGARLRLQNWRRLLGETNARLHELWRDHGPPSRLFRSAPVRVWADLLAADPAPPFAADDACLERLPLHVHRPDHAELLRVRGWLEHGELVLGAGAAG
ncbi:MAG: hypothetical protein JNL08_11885 [Planctomycetes bacterium]|nr:hypothetical protein [Planctomycetota bacterium]